MGAVTVAIVKRRPLGGTAQHVIADVTYSAGGDTYTPSQFGLTRVDAILSQAAVGSATTAYVVAPDLANNKIRLMASAAAGTAPTETATANQAATVLRLIAIGDSPYI